MNQITIDACPSTRNKTVVYFAILFTDCACAIKKDWSKEMSRPGMDGSHESVSNEAYPYSLASTNSDVLRLGFCTPIFAPLFLRQDPSMRTFPIEQGIRRRSRHLVHKYCNCRKILNGPGRGLVHTVAAHHMTEVTVRSRNWTTIELSALYFNKLAFTSIKESIVCATMQTIMANESTSK